MLLQIDRNLKNTPSTNNILPHIHFLCKNQVIAFKHAIKHFHLGIVFYLLHYHMKFSLLSQYSS